MHFSPPADTDSAQHKAENILLRRERDALQLEVRKLRGTAEFSGDRLTSTETEARRLKAQAQVCYPPLQR
jgi:hypothetical protein